MFLSAYRKICRQQTHQTAKEHMERQEPGDCTQKAEGEKEARA